MTKKTNWNSRMKGSSSDKPTRKKNQGFITSSFRVEEVLDESGEVYIWGTYNIFEYCKCN
jgi:hypothetical protein